MRRRVTCIGVKAVARARAGPMRKMAMDKATSDEAFAGEPEGEVRGLERDQSQINRGLKLRPYFEESTVIEL